MDKKTLLGLVIIGVILFGFSIYNAKQAEKYNEKVAAEKARIDSLNRERQLETPNAFEAETLPQAADSASQTRVQVVDQARREHFGAMLYDASQAKEEFYTVENDLMVITFSNMGGRIASVELKDYKTYNQTPLVLFDAATSKFDLSFFIKSGFNNTQINTSGYGFTPVERDVAFTGDEQSKTFAMRLNVDSASYVEYLYTIYKDKYMIDFDVRFVGMKDIMSQNQGDLGIVWENVGPQNEKGFDNENNYTTIAYNYPGEDGIEQLSMSKDTKSEDINTMVRWVAFKQQFFSSVIIAKDNFQNASIEYRTFQPGSGNIKKFYAKLSLPFSAQQEQYGMQFYLGPNKYTTLKKYDLHLEKLIPLGGWIIGWINRWIVIPVFDFLGKFISNYGIIILLLTIFIKILIAPLTYKSYLSTAKMRLLKPDIDKLNEKYPKQEDAMKKQQAVMQLYKSAGVNPMGGCLPLLIQFPILIAMFRFFPASIELRGEHFLWADDLSSYDSILNLPFDIPFYGSHVSLFALLMGISVYISSRINYTQTASAGPQMAGMKFMMLYMMPVMLVLWFNNYSSGLSYYYLVSNIFTIGQTYAFRYAVDDNKLHRKMKENAKKPQKKSKWAERYDEMLKQQQQQRAQQAKAQQKKK